MNEIFGEKPKRDIISAEENKRFEGYVFDKQRSAAEANTANETFYVSQLLLEDDL